MENVELTDLPQTEFESFPIDKNAKGKRTFTLWLDDYEMQETGTKDKNGKSTWYMVFNIKR